MAAMPKSENTTFELRPYQREAVDKLVAAAWLGKRVVVEIPTGGGKSLIIAETLRKLLDRESVR